MSQDLPTKDDYEIAELHVEAHAASSGEPPVATGLYVLATAAEGSLSSAELQQHSPQQLSRLLAQQFLTSEANGQYAVTDKGRTALIGLDFIRGQREWEGEHGFGSAAQVDTVDEE